VAFVTFAFFTALLGLSQGPLFLSQLNRMYLWDIIFRGDEFDFMIWGIFHCYTELSLCIFLDTWVILIKIVFFFFKGCLEI
jgi:hypothetical protein